MKRKVKIVMTQTLEFEPDERAYPPGATTLEMAEIDASTDDLNLLFGGENAELEIKYEAYEENEKGIMQLVGNGKIKY